MIWLIAWNAAIEAREEEKRLRAEDELKKLGVVIVFAAGACANE
jgi:hypothetical protein